MPDQQDECSKCGGTKGSSTGDSLPCSCSWMKGSVHESTLLSSKLFWAATVLGLTAVFVVYVNMRGLFPENTAATLHLSKAEDFIHHGEGAEAVKELQYAIELDPNRAALHYRLAQVLFQMDEPHQGLEHARIAAQLAPDNYDIQEIYAEALQKYGSGAESLKQFEAVVAKFRDQTVCRQQAALAFESAGKSDRAISLWKESLRLNPEVPFAWTTLAKLAYRTGNPSEAEKLIVNGLIYNPKSPKLHFWHGLILTTLDKPDLAITSLKKAAEYDPDYSNLITPIVEDYTQTKGQNISIVTLEKRLGGLYTEAVFNDQSHAKMQVDGTEPTCLISRKLAVRLGLPLVEQHPRVRFGTVVQPDEGISVILPSLKVGKYTANEVPCTIVDKPASEADGVIGVSFLSRFRFAIDKDVQQLILVRKQQ